MTKSNAVLPVSGRQVPNEFPFAKLNSYLGLSMATGSQQTRTQRTYLTGLRILADWLQEKGSFSKKLTWPLDINSLTTDEFLSFLNWLKRSRSQASFNTYISGIMGFIEHLYAIGEPPPINVIQVKAFLKSKVKQSKLTTHNAAKDKARQIVPEIVKRYCTLPLPQEGLQRIITLRNQALVATLYSSAIRVHEIGLITCDEALMGEVMIVGKRARPRKIHIQPYAQELIRKYLDERVIKSEHVFISHSNNGRGVPLTSTSVSTIVGNAIKLVVEEGGLTPHDFRHYRALALLRKGMPLERVQEFLGHLNIGTTRDVYAPVLGADAVAQALQAVDPSSPFD